jgi:hypothetical protein
MATSVVVLRVTTVGTPPACTHLAHKLLGVLLPQLRILIIKAQLGQYYLRQQHTQ